MTTALASVETAPLARVEAPQTPAELLLAVLDKGIPPDALEKTLAVIERMQDRDAERQFVAALAQFQVKCPAIPCSKTARITTKSGGSYSYDYAPLEDILPAIRPILAEHGLSISWDGEITDGGGKSWYVSTLIISHTAGHKERRTFRVPIESKAEGGTGASDPQRVAIAATFADRNAVVRGLGLRAGSDLDGAEPGGWEPEEKITETQVRTLNDLIIEVGADRQKFLGYCGVTQLSEIPARDFPQRCADLERKRKA